MASRLVPAPQRIVQKASAERRLHTAGRHESRSKVTFTESGNVDSRYMIDVYIPHLNAHWPANGRQRLLLVDHARAHYTDAVMVAFHGAGITVVMIPKGRTCFLQLCDTSLFATLRSYHKDQADAFGLKQRQGNWKVNGSES